MPRQFYIGKRSSSTDGGYWVGFENQDRLAATKSELYEHCLPCIQNLYRQLTQGDEEIDLGEAFDCWKVVLTLASEDDCLEVLRRYEEKYLSDEPLKGKFGKGRGDYATVALMFHCRDIGERDRLVCELKDCAQGVDDPERVFVSRGCSNLYAELFGPWEDWRKISPIARPQSKDAVIRRLKELLFKES